MRSRAHFKGHPIHAALIPFPFAFLIGGLLFDAAALLLDRPAWWSTGGHLVAAGIVAALIVAVPGLIDYLYTVPPESTGKQRATRHMIVNLSATTLFAVACYLRRDSSGAADLAVVGTEAVAAALLGVGGWMGGTLVSRNQIGVDHRYARAGKWKERRVEARPGRPVVVARTGDLEVDQMQLVHVGDRRVVVARSEDGYVAFDDRCPHRGGSLAGGAMIAGTVQCPWHGSQFDVRSGAVKAGPAAEGIATYQVEVDGGEVRLQPSLSS